MPVLTDYVRQIIPVNWIPAPSGWIHGNCPVCIVNGESRPDSKGRGGFKFDGQGFGYHCFNCGYTARWEPGSRFSGKLKKLFQQFGVQEADIQRLALELLREEDVSVIIEKKKNKKKVIIDWEEMQLPANAKPFTEWEDDKATDEMLQAIEYLAKRGFNPGDQRFMYSDAVRPGLMKKRFIIPFTYKGKVVGYTARWIGDVPEGTAKYFNQQPKNNFVYGLDRQQDKTIVIITEGPMDAIVTDGIAIGNNNINEQQADIIDNLNKDVILLPDADKSGRDAIYTAIDRGWKVSFPEWHDCKDASDAMEKYGRLYTIRTILDSAISNPIKIKVKMKGYCA